MAVTMLRLSACLIMLIVAVCFALRATAVAQDKEKVITNSIGLKLTLIPAGKFLMGSPAKEPERDPEELQHEVGITRPFFMGVYEVTQGDDEKLMGQTQDGRQYKP